MKRFEHLFRRKRVTVDAKVQGRLCLRVALYWLCCFLAIAFLMACSAMLKNEAGATELWANFGRVATLSFLALPLALLDCLIFSNKLSGPVHRLRLGLRDLADGKPTQPIKLRPGDFYQDMVNDFNRVVEHVQSDSHSEPADNCEDEESEVVAADPVLT